MVVLRDQAEEFPLCQQLYSCQRRSPKVGDARPKSGTEVSDQNVNKENREYQVKEDNRNIREFVRKNQEETDNPVGSEVNPHTSVNLSLIKRISRCAQSAQYIGSANGRPRYYLGPFQKDTL